MLLILCSICLAAMVGWFSLYQQDTFLALLLGILPPIGIFLWHLFRFSFVAAATKGEANGVAFFFDLFNYIPLSGQTAILASFVTFWVVRVIAWVYKTGFEPEAPFEDTETRKARIRDSYGMSEEERLKYKQVNHKRSAR